MPFVAAGGLADDQERTKAGLGIAMHLPQQQLADGLGLVGELVLPVARQDMDREGVLGHIERDDVVERAVSSGS